MAWDFFNKSIKNLFYALFFLIPLVLYPKTFELFEFNKLWTLFAISILILFFWVGKMVAQRKILFKRTPFDIPIGLFLLSQVVSTIFSSDPYVSLWGYYSRFNGGLLSITTYIFLYYAFVNNFPHVKDTDEEEFDEKGTIHKKFFLGGLASIVGFSLLVAATGGQSLLQDLLLLCTFVVPCILFIKAYHFPPIKKLLLFILTGGFIVSIWGFSSHFGYDFTCLIFRGSFDVSCWTSDFQPTIRLFSTLGQPNWLAAYFSILIPISLAMGIYKFVSNKDPQQNFRTLNYYIKRDKLQAMLYVLFSILLFIEVLWTQSQSGYLGLLSGLFVFFVVMIFVLTRRVKLAHVFKNITLRTFIVISIVFFLLSFFLSNPLAGRIKFLSVNGFIDSFSQSSPSTKSTPAAPATEALSGSDSGKIRLIVWSGALKLFQMHPLIGTGVETFAFEYYHVKPKTHNLLSEWDFLYNKAHNEYLNYLATTGIFGLGTYLLFIGWFIVYTMLWIIKRAKIPELKTLLIIGLLSSFVTILVSNFFGFSVVAINMFFFFIPGLVYYATSNTQKAEEKQFEMSTGKTMILILVGAICTYSLIQLLNYWYADQAYSLGYNLDRAQQYVQANQYLENAVNLYPAEDLYKNELSLNLSTLALLLYQQKQPAQAKTYQDRATQLSEEVIRKHPENISFYKTRVQTLFQLSDIDPKYYTQALEAIKYARTLAPTDAKLAYNEGLLYGQKENLVAATKALLESIDLKPNYREPRYALAVYLSQRAKEEKDIAKKEQLLNEAKDNLNYILKNITPGDTQTTELLKSLQ